MQGRDDVVSSLVMAGVWEASSTSTLLYTLLYTSGNILEVFRQPNK
jgi:hypothetical protein